MEAYSLNIYPSVSEVYTKVANLFETSPFTMYPIDDHGLDARLSHYYGSYNINKTNLIQADK